MKLILLFVLFAALICTSQGVVLSWEESTEGSIDYRLFYFNVPPVDFSVYDPPYFGLVNGLDTSPYGALGSLTCPTMGESVAVYEDVNRDGIKEWSCQSINVLPFAGQTTTIEPPQCSLFAPTETPALWNTSADSYSCGTYNQHLTLATREDINQPCQTGDFLQMYTAVEEIRCVNPANITPADTGSGARNIFSPRVNVNNDLKWYVIMSDMDMNGLVNRTWQYWKWSAFMNYDSSAQASLIPTPPVALPFPSQLVAVSYASFDVSSYTYVILPPSNTESFTGIISKLSPTLSETIITETLSFDSVSATSGQVTYSLTGLTTAECVAGEAFVGGVINRVWSALPSSSDQHLIAVTLWIQTNQSFTHYWSSSGPAI